MVVGLSAIAARAAIVKAMSGMSLRSTVHPLTGVREALEATVVGGEPAQATRNSPVPLILPIHAAVDTSVPPPPPRWGDRLWPGHVMGA